MLIVWWYRYRESWLGCDRFLSLALKYVLGGGGVVLKRDGRSLLSQCRAILKSSQRKFWFFTKVIDVSVVHTLPFRRWNQILDVYPENRHSVDYWSKIVWRNDSKLLRKFKWWHDRVNKAECEHGTSLCGYILVRNCLIGDIINESWSFRHEPTGLTRIRFSASDRQAILSTWKNRASG